MKTDMHMDVTLPVFPGMLQSVQTKEIVADHLIQAVDGAAHPALDDVAVVQQQTMGHAGCTPSARSETTHVDAVRVPLRQLSRAWVCFSLQRRLNVPWPSSRMAGFPRIQTERSSASSL